ncbi:hypothetical protein [Clavibacter michiganensis]|uniref:hypothetical protein n=1 Tax=Clavibacter michiganensis TaxID=28447 RepID=UPI000FFC4FC8|nr:hypothetical protein [Clavibacter michiganensis]MBE3077011.1 hypothetical protein [Clavibacter michiganensis subsp. michiganensis]MDO4101045.1 hypothetical protein [Clavibacter michiganensis]MDO4125926.1 hypothetical protein [Clavibacter michiganensis]MDO4128914.1 hypothetical protein [Clavibacter michiganensis]MDO4141129.1 hypothetical protein [Clavibacter michiganensis]
MTHALVWKTPLPKDADFNDLRHAVSELHGRRLVFDEIRDTSLRATTGVLFEAETFTGILVPAHDSGYYCLLSKVHELCHLIIRSAPDSWFSGDAPRPRQPLTNSRQFLRLCPRNSTESNDADSVYEELVVEAMARAFMRRLAIYADTTEEEHFA